MCRENLSTIVQGLSILSEKDFELTHEQKQMVEEYSKTYYEYEIDVAVSYSENVCIELEKSNDLNHLAEEQASLTLKQRIKEHINADFSECTSEIKDKVFNFIESRFSIETEIIDYEEIDPIYNPFFDKYDNI